MALEADALAVAVAVEVRLRVALVPIPMDGAYNRDIKLSDCLGLKLMLALPGEGSSTGGISTSSAALRDAASLRVVLTLLLRFRGPDAVGLPGDWRSSPPVPASSLSPPSSSSVRSPSESNPPMPLLVVAVPKFVLGLLAGRRGVVGDGGAVGPSSTRLDAMRPSNSS